MGLRTAAAFFSFAAGPEPRAGTGALAGGSLGLGSGIGTELILKEKEKGGGGRDSRQGSVLVRHRLSEHAYAATLRWTARYLRGYLVTGAVVSQGSGSWKLWRRGGKMSR